MSGGTPKPKTTPAKPAIPASVEDDQNALASFLASRAEEDAALDRLLADMQERDAEFWRALHTQWERDNTALLRLLNGGAQP
jgi:hypothetical protein